MATSELSVMLTAKGNLENELKSARDRVKDLSKEIRTIQSTGGTVGDDLAREFQQATRAAERLGREVNDTNRKIKTAAGQSTTAASKLGRAWKKTAGVFSNNVVAGLSAVSIALAGRAALNAYAEAEKQQSQLNLAYSKFPALANASRESFDVLNESLMNLTGADDDLLASAEAVLARFNLTGQEIQALIPLVNDYSVATGTELTASSETIGKALMGNARALKALGIDFKSTGNRGKDLSAIMVALEDKVGGAGEAFGKTTAGQMAIAQKNFENLQEEIGAALVPALEAVVSIVKPMSDTFRGLSNPVKQAAVAIAAVSVAALIVTPRIIAMMASMKLAGVTAGGVVGKMRTMGTFMMGPWGIALAAGAAALLDYSRQQQETEAKVDSLTAAMQRQASEGIRPTAEALVAMFTDWSSGQGTFQEQVDALGMTTEQFVTAVMAGPDEVEKLRRKLYQFTAAGGEARGKAQGLIWMLNDTSKAFGLATDKSSAVEAAMKALGYPTDVAAGSFEDLGDEAGDAAKKVNALRAAIDRMTRVSSRVQSLRAYRKAIREFVKKPSEDAALDAYDAFTNALGTFKDGSKAQAQFVADNYAKMERTVQKSGLSKKAKAQLLDPLRQARVEANRVLTTLDLINGKNVNANVNITTTGNAPYNPIRRAAGGLVTGPGTATSDSIPALLSNGEYVLRAAAVRRLGMSTLDKLNRADKMTDPALLDRMGSPASTASGPLIGSIVVNNPAQGMDVEQAVLRGMERAERIRRERAATRG